MPDFAACGGGFSWLLVLPGAAGNEQQMGSRQLGQVVLRALHVGCCCFEGRTLATDGVQIDVSRHHKAGCDWQPTRQHTAYLAGTGNVEALCWSLPCSVCNSWRVLPAQRLLFYNPGIERRDWHSGWRSWTAPIPLLDALSFQCAAIPGKLHSTEEITVQPRDHSRATES